MKSVPLNKPGFFALVDDRDFDFICQWRWHIHKPSPHTRTFYACRVSRAGGKRKRFYMHREILGCSAGIGLIDHINQNGLDNQRHNLRITTHRVNMHNWKQAGSSRFRGVSWNRERRKWCAGISLGNKKRWGLGRFDSEIEAAKAYNAAAVKLYGKDATLNEIPEGA